MGSNPRQGETLSKDKDRRTYKLLRRIPPTSPLTNEEIRNKIHLYGTGSTVEYMVNPKTIKDPKLKEAFLEAAASLKKIDELSKNNN